MKPTPYEMGFDYAVNGATTANCNFRLFSAPARTREWERGKKEGDKLKKDRRKRKGKENHA
jgi:hypothetical protein